MSEWLASVRFPLTLRGSEMMVTPGARHVRQALLLPGTLPLRVQWEETAKTWIFKGM